MDLYFHASPKKRLMFFKKNKTSSVRPTAVITQKGDTKATLALTSFLSNKASYHQVRKLWTQLKFQKSQGKPETTVLFDSQDHLEALPSSALLANVQSSPPPTPPPKKSHTLPNLVIMTDPEHLVDRALPSLPSASLEEKLSGPIRTPTWVGESIQRWFSVRSSQSVHRLASAASSAKQSLFGGRSEELLGSKSGQMLLNSELFDETEEAIRSSFSSSLAPNYAAEKMTLQSKILQISYLGSSKSYEYTLDLRATNNDVQTYYGVMRKAAKGLSVCHPRKALSFTVQGRFQVECHLTMKPHTSNSTLLNRLRSFRSNSDLSKSSMSKSTLGESAEEDLEQEEMIQGKLVLDSGEDLLHSFANKGIGRYTLQTSGSEVVELTIAFLLEKSLTEEEELPTPIDQDVLKYCSAGDYLTIYVKSEHHPTWNRYWATYESHQLVLRLNERGQGEPVVRFPLRELNQVNTNPSEDTKEEIYLGKKHGMILTFGKNCAFLFGDSYQSIRHWKCLMEQYASPTVQSHSIIHKKYLWSSSVAQ